MEGLRTAFIEAAMVKAGDLAERLAQELSSIQFLHHIEIQRETFL